MKLVDKAQAKIEEMKQKYNGLDRRKKCIVVGIGCLLCCVIMYVWFGIKTDKGTRPKQRGGAPLVAVYKAERRDMGRRVTLAGQTVSDASIDLIPKYDGRISDVRVDLGTVVKKGDILMVQDTENLDISIRQNTASTRQAEAAAAEAEAIYNANFIKAEADFAVESNRYERNLHLYEIGAISKDQLDVLHQKYLVSKAAYELLANQHAEGVASAAIEAKRQAALKEAYGTDALKKQRDDLIMRAPRDGVISYRNAEVGGMAKTNQKVFTLVDNSHMYVDCSLSESDAAVLEPGVRLDVKVESKGITLPGRLIFVSPAMEDGSRTYKARIELDKGEGWEKANLRAGLFARAYANIVQRSKAIFVPKEAVIKRNGKTSIFIVHDDLTVERRSIRVGLINDQMEEILEGVNEGETVAVTNQDKLADGVKIKVDEDYHDPSHGEQGNKS